ncbi:MAG: glycosyltransferase [Pseudomonadota bacterium]
MSPIPKRLSHIWIGPLNPPLEWMNSWRDKHPDWDYVLYDNAFLQSFPFKNRSLINEYFARGEYAGCADLIRYEVLLKFGGWVAEADSVCLNPVDELLTEDKVYGSYDKIDLDHSWLGISPFFAAAPGNPLIKDLVDRCSAYTPYHLKAPANTVGNRFLQTWLTKERRKQTVLFPSYMFIPWNKNHPGSRYEGPEKVYADQKWGTATGAYNKGESGMLPLGSVEIAQRRKKLLDDLSAPVLEAKPVAKWSGVLKGLKQDMFYRRSEEDLQNVLQQTATEKDGKLQLTGLLKYSNNPRKPLSDASMNAPRHALMADLADQLCDAQKIFISDASYGFATLIALFASPDAQITIASTVLQSENKDKTKTAIETYFAEQFPDRVTLMPKKEVQSRGFRKGKTPFDLLVLNGPNELGMLRGLQYRFASPMRIVLASPDINGSANFVRQHRVNGMYRRSYFHQSYRQRAGAVHHFEVVAPVS